MKADRRSPGAGPLRGDRLGDGIGPVWPIAHGGRSPPGLRLSLFTAADARGRNRRASDLVLLAAAALGAALAPLLGWAEPLWRSALFAALLLSIVIASDVIWRRRFRLARDVLV